MFGKIYSEGFSAKGQRVSNQDRFAMHNGACTTDCYVEQTIMANDELIYYILADGIGSMARGGDAASLAVNRLIDWLKSYDTWKANNHGAFEKFIEDGFDKVNQAVIEESIKTLDRWGTTLAALIIYKNNYYIANVGDSLIYKSSGNIARLQTEVSDAIHNRVLHNYIGNKLCSGSEMVRISKGKCTEGSFFLLCTDGLALVNDYNSNNSLMNNRDPRSIYDFFSSLEGYQLEDNCTILKVVLARLNTTILEDAIVRCESDSIYAKDILKNADRYFENWDEIIANRTRTYSVAEFVEMVSKDWEINPRTVRNWLGKKMPSRDNVLKMCASLNYGVNAANILLEKDAHYSRLDPTNTIDYAWCRLLNSESHTEENLLERYSLYLEEAYEKLPQGNYGDDYKECVDLIKWYMESENVNVNIAWESHEKAKKAYDYLSGKRKKGQFLPRFFLVAFSLHMNLTLDGMNKVLTAAGMQRLRSKSAFEASLIYVISKLEIENPELFADVALYDYRSEAKAADDLIDIVLKSLEDISHEISEDLIGVYNDCYKELISYL